MPNRKVSDVGAILLSGDVEIVVRGGGCLSSSLDQPGQGVAEVLMVPCILYARMRHSFHHLIFNNGIKSEMIL